jgi:hypothetical protein
MQPNATKKACGKLPQACDPAGIRTQGHLIKSQVLYRLSYGISAYLKAGAKV